MLKVRSATVAELPAVGRALAAAFADDPVWQHLRSPRADWSARAAAWFEADARTVLAGHGEVLVDDDLGGAALWAEPGHWRSGAREVAAIAPASARLFGRNLPRSLRALKAIEGGHPHQPEHWYLAILGTAPAHQGRGIGAALITSVTDRCDLAGVAAYLESSKEANVPYYERFGFQVRERIDLPGGGPPMWLMWREPQVPGSHR